MPKPPILRANNTPQNWKGAKYLIVWSTTNNEVFYLNYDHNKASTATYCNRDDVQGFIHDSWNQIKNKITTSGLTMTEDVQRIYDLIESGKIE